MDEKTRERLLRKADRLEHRLGVITDEDTGQLRRANASEQQARAIRLGGAARKYVIELEDEEEPDETTSESQARELLERYAQPQQSSRDPRVRAQRQREREDEEVRGT